MALSEDGKFGDRSLGKKGGAAAMERDGRHAHSTQILGRIRFNLRTAWVLEGRRVGDCWLWLFFIALAPEGKTKRQ